MERVFDSFWQLVAAVGTQALIASSCKGWDCGLGEQVCQVTWWSKPSQGWLVFNPAHTVIAIFFFFFLRFESSWRSVGRWCLCLCHQKGRGEESTELSPQIWDFLERKGWETQLVTMLGHSMMPCGDCGRLQSEFQRKQSTRNRVSSYYGSCFRHLLKGLFL